MLAPGAEFVVFLKNRDISITITFTADPSIMEYHQGLPPNNICTSCFMEHFYLISQILSKGLKELSRTFYKKPLHKITFRCRKFPFFSLQNEKGICFLNFNTIISMVYNICAGNRYNK